MNRKNWLQTKKLYQKVQSIQLAASGSNLVFPWQSVRNSALPLLQKPRNERFNSDVIDVVTLGNDYPVPELRGQFGVAAISDVDAWQTLAVYEGRLVDPAKTTPFSMMIVSDCCISGDPKWDTIDLGQISGIVYQIEPDSQDGNVSRFANDPRGHKRAANSTFVTVMTNEKEPAVLLVSTVPIEKHSPILVEYGENYWKK